MPRGGARQGAGRPKGQGKFSEATMPVRIPESMLPEVLRYVNGEVEDYRLPLYADTVQAGFPSPADDYIEEKLDLNQHLIKHPTATFFVKAAGDSMLNVGIHSGDILIVDRSLDAVHGNIVIALLDGDFTVKRLHHSATAIRLMPENDNYQPIEIGPDRDLVIWGVVTNVIHSL